MVFGIALSFLLIASSILWFVIGSKGYTALKAVMIIVCCTAAIVVFNTLNSYKGWPSPEDTPVKFVIKWVDIHEPRGKYQGDIFLWIAKPPKYALKEDEQKKESSILYYRGEDHEPRAHRVPYSKELHKMMQGVKQALKQGLPVMVDRSGQKSTQGKDGKKGKGGSKGPSGKGGDKSKGKGSWNFSGKQKWEFHILPPPKLPQKVMSN